MPQDAALEENLKNFSQLSPLEKLQTRVQKIHRDYQNLFNAVIDEYLEVADQWVEQGFIAQPALFDIREYGKQYFDAMTNFYATYATLLKQAGSLQGPTPATAFKLIVSSFDCREIKIPVYNRPNNIPFDLPQFIELLNKDLNYNLRRLYNSPELSAEELPEIQFSYTGKNSRVYSLYEKKPHNYHQLTVNALVEAHSLLQDWWIKNGNSITKGEGKGEDEVFKQSDFYKLLKTHPTLKNLGPKAIFELYFSAFKYAEKDCTDIQLLVNAIKELLIKHTLPYSYSNFDDFSTYTGTNKKVLQLIKETAEAKWAKIQIPYNRHIERIYEATKKHIKPEERAIALKNIDLYSSSFTNINSAQLNDEKAAAKAAYDEAFNDDGSFNLRAYQQSINSILKNKLKQDIVYTGNNELILDYFHPRHPADFHQVTANKLLEAHIKVIPWWDKYGPSTLGDEELIKLFSQSEFNKIIEEHPILKNLLPYERTQLYLSIFKDSDGRYDIPAFIQAVKKALQQSPHIYQSYASFSEYTGSSEAVNKAVHAAELTAAQKNYNEFLEKTYENATTYYYDREEKIDSFKKYNHKIFLSINPDKLNQLSMLDSYIASLNEEDKFDLLAFQITLNSVLETNLNFKIQYTGTDKKVLNALQVPTARNVIESKSLEIPTEIDKHEENTRARQPVPDGIPVPNRPEAERSLQPEILQTTASDTIYPESASKTKQNSNLFFSANSSTKKEGGTLNLQESLQNYINDRKKEWSFHYNFLNIVTLIYFFHDKILGTDYLNHKSRETKIKAAENIMNGNFPLNDAQKAAASEGRLGKLLSEFDGLEEIMKKAPESTRDDQNLQS